MRTIIMIAFGLGATVLIWLAKDRTQIIILYGILAYCTNEALKGLDDD